MPARKSGVYYTDTNAPARRLKMRASHYLAERLEKFARQPRTLEGRPQLVRMCYVVATRAKNDGVVRDWFSVKWFKYNFTDKEKRGRWASVQVQDKGWRIGYPRGEFGDLNLPGNLWKHLEYARVDLEIAKLAHANYVMVNGDPNACTPL
jgi:hypothetical protein